MAVRTAQGERFPRVDWYGEDLGASVFVGCEFVDADLTEVTTKGARFEDCEFRGGQLNASTHDGTSFTGCRFTRRLVLRGDPARLQAGRLVVLRGETAADDGRGW